MQHKPLNIGEKGKLWDSGELGCGNPIVLLHMHCKFCLRGIDKHRRMCYGDF